MEFSQLVAQHRSIRKYQSTPIPEELLATILDAGRRASSSGNMQTYSIIATSNKGIRQQLYKAHFEQEMLLEAPTLLTFCSDFHRMRHWVDLSAAPPNFDNFMSFMIGAIDAILASQNVALAAENAGLGICYMGTTLASCDEIARILGCPAHVVPVVGFVIGYPDELPPVRDRLPLAGLVHQETYQDYTAERIHEIYSDRETKGWDRYLNNPELKKLIEESGVTNLAQVYTQLKYTRTSHIEYSATILKLLKESGFFNHQ